MIEILKVLLSLGGVAISMATNSNAPQEIIDGLQASLTEIQKVHDIAVTKTQVDGLLDTPLW
jgi:hypothetical protein